MPDSPSPHVSIITPTYNREAYLAEAIESVLTQSYANWQMLIIDDGSTDGTEQVVRTYSKTDSRVIYCHQHNQGAAVARNNAIRQAKGKYLTFLDSDDTYLPGALTQLVTAIESAPPEVKLVYGDFIIFDEQAGTRKPITATPPFPRPKLYYQFLISGGNPIVPSASIAEREAIQKLGLFNPAYENIEDTELWTRLIQKYDIGKVAAQIAVYRRHEFQKTNAYGKRRYWRDKTFFKLFQDLDLKDLFPEKKDAVEKALEMENLAKMMLASTPTPFDTALHILKLAQQKQFSLRRKKLLNRMEREIPDILRQQYGHGSRISTDTDLSRDVTDTPCGN